MSKRTLYEAITGNIRASEALEAEYVELANKTEKGHYKYLTPSHLSAPIAREYEETMNSMFATYASLLRELTGYLRKADDKPHALSNAEWKQQTQKRAAQIASATLPLGGMVERKGTARLRSQASDKLLSILDRYVSQNLSPESEVVSLIDFQPRNELEIIEPILFELSSQPARLLEGVADDMKIDDRYALVRRYFNEKRLRAAQSARYSWEIIATAAMLQELQSTAPAIEYNFQDFSPRHGYEMPVIIETAGLVTLFERNFDTSYELFSKLQLAGNESEGALACLLGHKLRWRIGLDATELGKLMHARNLSDATQQLLTKLDGDWRDVHPTIRESLA